VYDLYHTIIPDVWSYSFGALALVYAWMSPHVSEPWYLVISSGPLVALPLFLLWFYSRGSWMGLGDAKLALGIGWLLGLLHGYVALGLAFFIGAIVGVFILLPLPNILDALARAGITRMGGAKAFTMKSEVPFGPFLICALLIVWFSQLYGLGLVMHLARFLSWS
jgi:prepilin signal peptidase PulO-like enzyme (type II secretory pathway)